MNHQQLIASMPDHISIADRMILIDPEFFGTLIGNPISGCRIFLMVVNGHVTIGKSSQIQVVQANQFLDVLAWEPIEFIEASDNIEAWCLLPNYIFTNESLNGMRPEDTEPFKDRHSIPLIHLTAQETQKIIRQLSLLRDSLHDITHFYRIELCQSYFRNFMLETGNIILHRHNAAEKSTHIENRQDWIVRRFLKLVWKHYRTEHNVAFYAQQLCLSEKHISRVVREKLGKTPYAVIRDELLQRAMYLLKDTKVPVQDISADLHFSETPAFCKFFKKHKGVSPSAFRSRKSTDSED